tara:strand:- start:381 stop:497 length:117 start_codon:yes stop_codon:yes gene_type:complete
MIEIILNKIYIYKEGLTKKEKLYLKEYNKINKTNIKEV